MECIENLTFLIASSEDRVNIVLEIKNLNDQIEHLETQNQKALTQINYLHEELETVKQENLAVFQNNGLNGEA